jgi:NADP-dependent 3-hydroxy acid dehydrogenase YdfG
MAPVHWIIGATHGIGRAVAEAALVRGEAVYASGRDHAALAQLVAAYPAQCQALPLDITDQAAVEHTVAQLPQPLASVQIYAGVYTPTAISAASWDNTLKTIMVNLTGVLGVVQAVLPRLRAQAAQGVGVQLVVCGSVAGRVGLPNGQPYSATKAALFNYCQSLRAEELAHAARTGNAPVDVKIILPGFVKTRLTAQNTFTMPFLLEPAAAAQDIWRGLAHPGRFTLEFPWPTAWGMRLLASLPDRFYFALARRL